MEYKDGDLIRYQSRNSWCHHGILVVRPDWKGSLVAFDTYWGTRYPSSQDVTYHTIAGLTDEPVCNLNEMRKSHSDEWDTFADADRFWIPIGGGSEQYLVKASAVPVPERQRAKLLSKIEGCEASIRSANWSIERYREELAKLEVPA